MNRTKWLSMRISFLGLIFYSWSVYSQQVIEITQAPSLEISSTEWQDYLIQDVCLGVVDDNDLTATPSPIYGDPNTCHTHRDLQVGESILSNFRYSEGELSLSYSFPRVNSDGDIVVMNLVSDAADHATNRGTYDFDDPHCAVLTPGLSPVSPCGVGSESESDIFDITEVDLDSSWLNVVSIAATAHASYTGLTAAPGSSEIGFYTNNFIPGASPDFPDGWVLGVAEGAIALTEQTENEAWNVFTDSTMNSVSSYTKWASFDKNTCGSKLDDSPSSCDATSYHQWLKVEEVYMGEGKKFNSVIIASHSSDISPLEPGCDTVPHPNNPNQQIAVACRLEESCRPGHQEVFYFSKEYGFMRHEVWKNSLCEPETSEIEAIQCPEGTGLQSPRLYNQSGEVHELRRTSCAQWVSNGANYQFDPDSIPAVSKSQAYPNVEVYDKLGKGNLLMNPQFAWSEDMKAWKSEVDSSGTDTNKNIVVSNIAAAAKFNRSVEVVATTAVPNAWPWISQDVTLGIRSPSTKGKFVRFGARIKADKESTSAANINICLYQLGDTLSLITYSCEVIGLDTNTDRWNDNRETFVEAEGLIDAQTETLRFQIHFPTNDETYYIDDAFIVEN